MGPVTLLAHAADADRLQSIEFRIDGAPVGMIAIDAERFGEAGLEWLPPGPGTYSLDVVALNAGGGRGSSARVEIIIADASQLSYGTPTPAPANAPSIVITGITCGPKYTVNVDFEVTSPSGVVSVEIFSTYTATTESKLTFTAPYPLTVKDSLLLDEGDPDFLDRPHQVNVVAILVDQPKPVAVSAWEPGPQQRCPGHYEGDQQLAATLSTQALWIARLNTNCRIGPGTAYDSQDVIESGAQAPIDGQNAEGTWFRVQPPGSSRTCWVSTASGEVQGDLSPVPVIAVAPIATASPAAGQPGTGDPGLLRFAGFDPDRRNRMPGVLADGDAECHRLG